MKNGKMSLERRQKLEKRVLSVVQKKGSNSTAYRIGITPATLRRFLHGKPCHEATLRLIERMA